jgi:hypothetical protein
MRNKLLAGLTTAVAAAAIAAPAQAQVISAAPAGPAIQQSGKCKVRHSNEGKGFTYASCEFTVSNVPAGKSVKVAYKSNLKTFKPSYAEFGPFSKQSGTISNDGDIQGLMFAFPGKTAAQVKQRLKITLTGSAPGLTVSGATLTA